MKAILAFDSYKGCLTAHDACQAASLGLRDVLPDARIITLPMSDGGEGMVECVRQALDLSLVRVAVHGPLMEPRQACYALSHDRRTAYMEMAEASGLTLVPVDRRNPMLTTTCGVGEMLLDAVRRGCRHIVMGIGGSATCDGGRGMVEALQGHLSYDTGSLSIDADRHAPYPATCLIDGHPVRVTVASDVTNPLCGPRGAAAVFAPQKGATPHQVTLLDQRLHDFALATETLGLADPSLALAPGAGAAGGLGYALMAYLRAQLCPGISLMLDLLGFDGHLTDATLILTGEGCSDRQTLMGKVPQGVLSRSRGIPVHLLSGAVTDVPSLLAAGFASVRSINQGDSRPLAVLMQKDVAAANLRRACSELVAKSGIIPLH